MNDLLHIFGKRCTRAYELWIRQHAHFDSSCHLNDGGRQRWHKHILDTNCVKIKSSNNVY